MNFSNIWPLIVAVYELCQNTDKLEFIAVKGSIDDFEVHPNELVDGADLLIVLDDTKILSTQAKTVICCSQPFSFDLRAQGELEQESLTLLSKYLPYALLGVFAKQQQRIFVISHFAQTLDGKIATVSGDSKWIGNDENLVHAHRMRALCDAVMVGSNTYKIDNPKLDVRHVEGKNPLKVVIGNSSNSPELHDNGKMFIDTKGMAVVNGEEKDVSQILGSLVKKGVCSIYLEGGATTTSAFLRQGGIDQLQIHFSSKILGSGKQGYDFEGIDCIRDSIQFKNPRFVPVGDEMMFLGEL